MRSSSTGSLATQASQGRMRSSSPLSRAAAACAMSMRSSRRCTGNASTCGWMTPASSLDTSSRPSNSALMAAMACSTRSPRRRRSVASGLRRHCATIRFSACRGWRRSWLAAASRRDLARFASDSSRVRSSTCRPRLSWLACSSAAMALKRSPSRSSSSPECRAMRCDNCPAPIRSAPWASSPSGRAMRQADHKAADNASSRLTAATHSAPCTLAHSGASASCKPCSTTTRQPGGASTTLLASTGSPRVPVSRNAGRGGAWAFCSSKACRVADKSVLRSTRLMSGWAISRPAGSTT